MSALVLSLRGPPDQRLDLSALVPNLLARNIARDISRLEIHTTRDKVTVGDAFRLRMGDLERIRIEGSTDRLDGIGTAMTGGEITVEGDAGACAGRLMAGGRLTITGNCGPWAASGLRGGVVEIGGNCGDRLGGPLAGETAGMRGGVVVVRGGAGERAGDRLRRGTIVVEGRAGTYSGCAMVAGTIVLAGGCDDLPGYLMRRGTMLIGGEHAPLPPTFINCGRHRLVAMRLMADFLETWSRPAARLARRPLARFAGDMAALGKGEIFLAGQ